MAVAAGTGGQLVDFQRQLFNPGFEGYKFSGAQLPVTVLAPTSTPIRGHRIGLEDPRRFNVALVTATATQNKLFPAPLSAGCNARPVAYFISGSGDVCQATWSSLVGGEPSEVGETESGGEDYEELSGSGSDSRGHLMVTVVAHLPDYDSATAFEMDSLVFARPDIAVCGYGTGQLVVFSLPAGDDERAAAGLPPEPWEIAFHTPRMLASGSFVVRAARMADGESDLLVCMQQIHSPGPGCTLVVGCIEFPAMTTADVTTMEARSPPVACEFFDAGLCVLSSQAFLPRDEAHYGAIVPAERQEAQLEEGMVLTTHALNLREEEASPGSIIGSVLLRSSPFLFVARVSCWIDDVWIQLLLMLLLLYPPAAADAADAAAAAAATTTSAATVAPLATAFVATAHCCCCHR